MEIRKLRPQDDLGRAAEILFQADPYIMPDLLGDSKTARLVGGCLFSEDEEQLFCFERTLVAVQDGDIRGILCYRTCVCHWDAQILHDEFVRKGCTSPAEFERVNREYFDKIANTELPRESTECMFLAVDKDVRKKKVGSQLLQFWLKTGFRGYLLDVLSENAAAITLYSQHGFITVCEHLAYPAENGYRCFNMRKG